MTYVIGDQVRWTAPDDSESAVVEIVGFFNDVYYVSELMHPDEGEWFAFEAELSPLDEKEATPE